MSGWGTSWEDFGRQEGVIMARWPYPWHAVAMDATLVLGKQGRLVIPAEVRTALGLVPGDRLHLHLSGPRLVLERKQDAVAYIRTLSAEITTRRPLVDELLAESSLPATT